jgi:hypothetical protein
MNLKTTTPTYLDLHSTHRLVLNHLQHTTSRTMKSLVTEAIEDLAVKYEVVKEKHHIYSRTDWIPMDTPVTATIDPI